MYCALHLFKSLIQTKLSLNKLKCFNRYVYISSNDYWWWKLSELLSNLVSDFA